MYDLSALSVFVLQIAVMHSNVYSSCLVLEDQRTALRAKSARSPMAPASVKLGTVDAKVEGRIVIQ
jgi:hypothetical protein